MNFKRSNPIFDAFANFIMDGVGRSEDMIRTFCKGRVTSHIPFQLMKLMLTILTRELWVP